jgi:polyferredoxin
MDKIGRPRGLVRYASLNGINTGATLRFTARMKLYTGVLTGLILLFLFLVFTRTEVQTLFLRARGALYQQTAKGNISNLYTVKVVNKCTHDMPIEFHVENLNATLSVMGAKTFIAPKAKLVETSVLVEIEPAVLTGNTTPLVIGVYSGGRKLETIKTSFVGPRH